MRPKERRDSGQNNLFRARLDQTVDIDHPLAKLGRDCLAPPRGAVGRGVFGQGRTSAAADAADGGAVDQACPMRICAPAGSRTPITSSSAARSSSSTS